MRFTTGVFAIVAAISAVLAQENPISHPTAGDTISAGKPFKIVWQPTTSGTITLKLRKGTSTNLQDVDTITAGSANSGSFEWTPSADLSSGDNYAIEIVDSAGNVNYTPQFGVSSNVASESSSVSSTISSSASSSTKSEATTSASTSEKTHSDKPSHTATVATVTSANATTTHHHLPTITSTKHHNSSSTESIFTTSITKPFHHNATTTLSNHTKTATSTKSKSSSSATSSSTSSTPSGTGVPDSAANTILRSPLALVLCVIGAIMYLN